MAKNTLEKQARQLVTRANQYFKETYDIYPLYDIHYFFGNWFVVFCKAVPRSGLGSSYNFVINQNLYDNLITVGKNIATYGKSNIAYLEQLQKYGISTQTPKHITCRILIIFYNVRFYIDIFTDNFKEAFYINLVSILARNLQSNSVSQYREDKNYQAFVQFAIHDISHVLYSYPNLTKHIIPSFSKETMEMYQAIATLHELKDA